MDERWEAYFGAALNLAYLAAVLVLVVGSVPPLRAAAEVTWRRQVHAWQLGRWLERRTPPPSWTTLLAREDLPSEAT